MMIEDFIVFEASEGLEMLDTKLLLLNEVGIKSYL
jgi:hypothetical protein